MDRGVHGHINDRETSLGVPLEHMQELKSYKARCEASNENVTNDVTVQFEKTINELLNNTYGGPRKISPPDKTPRKTVKEINIPNQDFSSNARDRSNLPDQAIEASSNLDFRTSEVGNLRVIHMHICYLAYHIQGQGIR